MATLLDILTSLLAMLAGMQFDAPSAVPSALRAEQGASCSHEARTVRHNAEDGRYSTFATPQSVM